MSTRLAGLATSACMAALALASAQPAGAVKPGAVSMTAEIVCEFRAIAALHPDPKLRNPDGLADELCPPRSQLPRAYASSRVQIDHFREQYAAYFYVNARTMYIDAALERAVAQGATQVVILGAGFDSRAYRFHERYPALRFFEVDLPATLEDKKNRLVMVFGKLPDYVQYASIDFDHERLEDVLPRLGYESGQRTFFILEGVTMYVKAPGNAVTMRFISAHAPRGSRVVYDYLIRRVIEGRFEGLYAVGNAAIGVAGMGEPFVTGWTPREAAAFARKNGLRVVEDLGAKELTQRFLIGSDGKPDGRMIDGHRIIEAMVP